MAKLKFNNFILSFKSIPRLLHLFTSSFFDKLKIVSYCDELNIKSCLLSKGFSVPQLIKIAGLSACQSIFKYSDSNGNITL